jgi:helix-turn-helix protein
MSNTSTVPLLQEWLDFSDGKVKSEALLQDFVRSQLTAANVDVPGSKATLLYPATVGGQILSDQKYQEAFIRHIYKMTDKIC